MIVTAVIVLLVILVVANVGLTFWDSSRSKCSEEYFKSINKDKLNSSINGLGTMNNYRRRPSKTQTPESYMSVINNPTMPTDELKLKLEHAESVRNGQFNVEQERSNKYYIDSKNDRDAIDKALEQVYNIAPQSSDEAKKTESKFGKAGAHSAVFELELEGLRAGIPAKNRTTTNSLNTVSERDGYTSRK
jgi:hypothetical protein